MLKKGEKKVFVKLLQKVIDIIRIVQQKDTIRRSETLK